jgi:excinuclease ABC subunit B
LEQLVAELNEQMLMAAAELKFELAARLRDELSEIKRDLRTIRTAGHG